MTGSNWNKTGMAPSTKLPHHAQKATPWQTTEQPETIGIKFIYSEKATIFCKIFTLLLSYVVPVKNKVKSLKILWPSQNIWTLTDAPMQNWFLELVFDKISVLNIHLEMWESKQRCVRT